MDDVAAGLPGPDGIAAEYASLAGAPGCCVALDPRTIAELAARPEAVREVVRSALAPLIPRGHTFGLRMPRALSLHLAGRASHYGIAEALVMEIRPRVLHAILAAVGLAEVVPRDRRSRVAISVPEHVAEEWMATMEPVALRLGWRLLRDRFPDPGALQRLVLRHEGKHAALRLARRGGADLPQAREESVCDVHGAAMAAAETGVGVAAALADFRAVSCLMHAAAGHPAWFTHWTVSALDAAAPAVDAALADGRARGWTSRSASDEFDARAAAEAPAEPDILSRRMTALGTEARGVSDLLARAADDRVLRPYALRMGEALGRIAEPA